MADGMMAVEQGVPEGQVEQGGGGAAEQVAGLLGAAEFLRDRIVESPDVPDELKQAVAQATAQYVQVIGQVIGGGQAAQPAETIPGAQPVTPQGVQ
jgi:hypothetical protein